MIYSTNFMQMLINKKNILEKKNPFILIFIQKITMKNLQELNFFLQKNNFGIKRITKNYNKNHFGLNFGNSNFILESHSQISNQELQNVITFLNQYTSVNGVFFKEQILNVERIVNLTKQSRIPLWKTINNLNF